MRRETFRALNKLAKWRTLLTGWHMGTRPKGDAASDSYRDLQEFRLILRVEVSALTRLLIDKGVFTEDEFDRAMEMDARLLDQALADKFPGVTATEEGLQLNPAEINQAGWMKGWPL